MKINNFNRIAVFGVVALVLGGATVAHNIVISKNDEAQEVGVFAATGKRIEGVVATGSLKARTGSSDTHHIDRLSLDISSVSNVKAGDYIEIEFNKIQANYFNNYEVRVGDIIVGKMILQREWRDGVSGGESPDAMPGDNAYNSIYRVVFNDNAENFDNFKISLNGANLFGWNNASTVETNIKQLVKVNGVEVVSNIMTRRAIRKRDSVSATAFITAVWVKSPDGERVVGNFMDLIVRQRLGDHDRIIVGDVIEYSLPSDSGVVFDTSKIAVGRRVRYSRADSGYVEGVDILNQHNVIGYAAQVADTEVLEASPHRVRVKILNIDDRGGVNLRWQSPVSIVDTSEKTIDYVNNKLIARNGITKIYRDDQEIKVISNSVGGDIEGSKLKAYAQIRKRGSIIRQIQDEKGNKIPGFESDKLILERVQEGTAYDVPAPEIPGYTFARLAPNSATQKGTVREGIQNVILVYKISAQNITIKIGDTPDPKSHIPDFDKNFPGCEVKYKETPDTSKSGTIDTTLIISCPDQPDREVFVQIIVEEEPKPKPPKTQESHPEAPNTGSQSTNLLSTVLAGLSTISILAAILFKKK